MLKYEVRVDYGERYEFTDGNTALRVAEILLTHSDKEEVNIEIKEAEPGMVLDDVNGGEDDGLVI